MTRWHNNCKTIYSHNYYFDLNLKKNIFINTTNKILNIITSISIEDMFITLGNKYLHQQ